MAQERKNRRIIPHRLEKVGYVPARNDTAQDGLWKINGARQVVYAKSALSVRDRFKAVEALRDKIEAEAKAKEEAAAQAREAAKGKKQGHQVLEGVGRCEGAVSVVSQVSDPGIPTTRGTPPTWPLIGISDETPINGG